MNASSDALYHDYLASIATLEATTQKNQRIHLELFRNFIWTYGLDFLECNVNDLIKFAKAKLDSGLRSTSVKTYLVTLKSFYCYAFEEELYPFKDYRRIERYLSSFRVEVGEAKTRLTDEEIKILFEAVDYHLTLKAATWTLLNFGLRYTELMRLKVTDIDFANEVIHIYQSKGKKTRRVPIMDFQVQDLNRWLDLRDSFLLRGSQEEAYLILKRTEKPPGEFWLRTTYFRIRQKHPIYLYAHRLRRTYACILYYEVGVPIYSVQWALGHARLETTMHYLGISEEEKIADYRKPFTLTGKRIVPATL